MDGYTYLTPVQYNVTITVVHHRTNGCISILFHPLVSDVCYGGVIDSLDEEVQGPHGDGWR